MLEFKKWDKVIVGAMKVILFILGIYSKPWMLIAMFHSFSINTDFLFTDYPIYEKQWWTFIKVLNYHQSLVVLIYFNGVFVKSINYLSSNKTGRTINEK